MSGMCTQPDMSAPNALRTSRLTAQGNSMSGMRTQPDTSA
eukprot:CAMPEP_0198214384 /NCGR_PEP_ID=MMETSP1445-20131203/41030_1 /TAXON_ID=36898 /ORGANISM="Pyramimonas sp., Strain CCMP2087" /LENGTH=39 /DNA_ID= /DNA_START= /DNA_END= /DNA_ORIENTATION=